LGLSKKAKLKYLREGIKQEKRSGIIYNGLSVVGLVGLVIGFIGWAFDLIIMGVAVFAFGLVMGFYCNKRKDDLMEQLRELGYKEKE
jgi:hypothetical protein